MESLAVLCSTVTYYFLTVYTRYATKVYFLDSLHDFVAVASLVHARWSDNTSYSACNLLTY